MIRSTKIISGILLAVLCGCATVKTAPQPQARIEQGPPSLTGKVVETMDVASYTYMNLEDTKGRRTWYAVPATKVALGQVVTVAQAFEMVNFRSRELNRTFDKIYFSGGLVGDFAARRDALSKAHGEDQASGAADPQPAAEVKVDRAPGPNAYTIAELYQKRDRLDKQAVEVRGKVVKVSKGVMGKNWLHLRDGSGDAAHHDNDLVATTTDDAALGEVMTVHGIVYKDKDFGSGYKYAVIMEEGSIRR